MKTINRIMQLDLDVMCDKHHYDHDDLVEYIEQRLKNTGANTVYIQLSSEDVSLRRHAGSRTADALLFDPGEAVDARVLNADIFKDAVQIVRHLLPASRILAWSPTLYSAFLLPDNTPVAATAAGRGDDALWYQRASPFSAETRQRLIAFYTALGQVSESLDGVMLQDDLLLSDWEDTSSLGKALLAQRYGLTDLSDRALGEFLENEDDARSLDWRRYKASVLDELSKTLFDAFRRGYQQAFPARFAARERHAATRLIWGRDYYDAAVLSRTTATGEWYAQNLDTALDLYDHVVVMAYFNMCNGSRESAASVSAQRWLRRLVRKAIAIANSDGRERADRLVFKLQSVLWDDDDERVIPATALQKQVYTLLDAGATSIGFYPSLQGRAHFDMAAL